jgi:hypothetical protein
LQRSHPQLQGEEWIQTTKYNSQTKQSTWERPKEIADLLEKAKAELAAAESTLTYA